VTFVYLQYLYTKATRLISKENLNRWRYRKRGRQKRFDWW